MSKINLSATVPPAAAYALYRAYKSGSFDGLKDKIFAAAVPDSGSALGVTAPSGSTIEIVQADTVHGQEALNVEFDPEVYQYYDDTCAIQSQHLILQQYGIEVSQEELIEIAKQNGWYAEGYGTPMDMVGKLLEHFGVEIHGSQGNNIFNLANELAQGHQIIVGVDANELVFPEQSTGIDELYGEQANHALVVVGIDTSDPDNVQVIVTDPGTGNRQMAYPADQFVDAWKDSDCFMVSTDTVPTNPLWDYSPIDSFAGIPTETLGRLADADFACAGDSALFGRFVNDFLADTSGLDDLMTQYGDLFAQHDLFNDSDSLADA